MKEQTIKEVNRIFNCDILDRRRKKNNVSGRVAFSYYMRLKSNLKLREIGEYFDQDCSAIYRNTKVHHNFFKYDCEYRQMYLELEKLNPMNICNHVFFDIKSIRKTNQSKNLKK